MVLDDTDADVLLLEAADADVEALVVTGVEVAVNPVLLDDVADNRSDRGGIAHSLRLSERLQRPFPIHRCTRLKFPVLHP